MHEQIQEYTTSHDAKLRIDHEASILRGVKLLGLVSSNGRRYSQAALSSAMPLYERAKVNVNHAPGGPLAPRNYQERFGVINNVRLREGVGLFGDLHFNPKHPVADQLLWDAENAPENVGLSHNVLAKTSKQHGETVVEIITQVNSVDLVADPATTKGLFEQAETSQQSPNKTVQASEEQEQTVDAIPLERRERVYALLTENSLPLPGVKNLHAQAITSEEFLESLWNAPNETTLRTLIERRAAIVKAAREWQGVEPRFRKPISRDQLAVSESNRVNRAPTVLDFVQAVSK